MSHKKPHENPRNSKPISLYPMKPEDAIGRALSTPLHKPPAKQSKPTK